MNSRVLPVEEWPRLKGTEAEAVWPHFDPENTYVLVVEDEAEIVGTWVLMRMVHVECLWIAPSHRGVFGVAKRLLSGMYDLASTWGASSVITGSLSDHVADLISRLGGVKSPGESYILPAYRATKSERTACQQQSLSLQL